MTDAYTLGTMTERTFTPERTRPILEEACKLVGLDASGALILRHHTNAVYQLTTTPIVVKIARPSQTNLRNVVALVRWAAEQGIPTVQLVSDIRQPFEIAGCAITVWHYLPQVRPIAAVDIAGPLRALHSAPTPPVPLPALDALGAIKWAIDESRLLGDDQRRVLLEKWDRLHRVVPTLPYEAPPRLIHGDPQHRNTLWDEANNQAVLCDWDSAAIGHVEWDLVTIEVHCRRFGHTDYASFCKRYGRDVRTWAGYEPLRELRELRMIATNARKSRPRTPQASEVLRRIATLDNNGTEAWKIL